MKLSAHPFHPTTGDLLPTYRDAYLRGDLTTKNMEAVDAYLKANSQHGDTTLRRYYELTQSGHAVQPLGWVARQFELIRTEPQRFRRRATSLVAGSALLGGAVFANTNLPTNTVAASVVPTSELPAELLESTESATASVALRMKSVRGRVLDESGKPLVGATIIDKVSGRGVSTNASGNYVLLVPATHTPVLQYGYAGYSEEEIQVPVGGTYNTTLTPRKDQVKKRPWWKF